MVPPADATTLPIFFPASPDRSTSHLLVPSDSITIPSSVPTALFRVLMAGSVQEVIVDGVAAAVDELGHFFNLAGGRAVLEDGENGLECLDGNGMKLLPFGGRTFDE